MNLLEQIENFGAIDAENDERLIEYFFRTPIIDKLLNYQKSIIIGRKGSGKTAIYKYIQNVKKETCIPLLFKDYPWKTHDRFKNSVVSERESFVNSWTFFFYIEIIKKIIELKESFMSNPSKKKIKKLKKWIKQNWGSINFDHKEVMSPKKIKTNWSINPQLFGFGLGSLSRDLTDKDNMGATLSEYNKKLEAITTDLMKDFSKEIILIFDELDLSYSPNDLNYKDRLIGLLLATYNFYNKFPKTVKIFIFLRNDIFNLLEFQDKNKIKDNMVEFLDWDSESLESILSLKSLISNRIKNNTNSNSDNFDSNWNEIFESKNMGKNQFLSTPTNRKGFQTSEDFFYVFSILMQDSQASL